MTRRGGRDTVRSGHIRLQGIGLNMLRKRRRAAAPSPGKLMLPIYQEMDRALSAAVADLQNNSGLTPTCTRGCHFCCRQQIPTQPLEVAAVTEYIQEKFSKAQIAALRDRMREWFRWLRNELPKLTAEGVDLETAFYAYGPYCPLLVNGECSVYAVRPAVCRTHFVSSDPRSCRPRETDPDALEQEPNILYEITIAVSPILHRLRNALERSGIRIEEATMLLPQSLVIHMNWQDLWDGPEADI